jgi:hypothetical protein
MKIIIVILFTFISLSSVSAKQSTNQNPTGTYTYTIDEVYNELDIFEMDTDTLSINDIRAEVQKKKLFANIEVDIQVVQLWEGKFHKVSGNKFNINEFDEHKMFIRVKVQ